MFGKLRDISHHRNLLINAVLATADSRGLIWIKVRLRLGELLSAQLVPFLGSTCFPRHAVGCILSIVTMIGFGLLLELCMD